MQAILATAAIAIWHFYMVLFDPDVYPMEKHWLTGRVSSEHLKKTRPEYYARLMAREAREEVKGGQEGLGGQEGQEDQGG